MTKVAVVGLGAMGSRIAGRLIAAGNEVVVWNRDNSKTVPLTQSGATAAETPAAAARRADVVITMVSNPAALRAVTEGQDGVVAGAEDGTAIVQMSTVGPAPVQQLASALPSGVGLLDAPVLGSIAEAEAGTLHIFVGGDDEAVERWGPLLSTLGQVHYVGPVGAGSAAKLWHSRAHSASLTRSLSTCSRRQPWEARPNAGATRSSPASIRRALRSRSRRRTPISFSRRRRMPICG